VKNGSAGRVTAIDAGELVVEFEREGIVRVPRSYLAAGHLEYGYARTGTVALRRSVAASVPDRPRMASG
jgi:hypothetical protein